MPPDVDPDGGLVARRPLARFQWPGRELARRAVLDRSGREWPPSTDAQHERFPYRSSTGLVVGPALPVIRFASSAAVLNGRIHLVGGWNYNNTNSQSLASHDAFDLASQQYLPAAGLAPLAQARNAAAHGVIDGKLYIVGGRAPGIRDHDAQRLAGLEIYTPSTNAWEPGPAMPTARSGASGAVLNGKLYVLGGELAFPDVSEAVERYDPTSRQWSTLAPLPFKVHSQGAVVVEGAIYMVGGFRQGGDAIGSESPHLYRYVPEA